MANTRTHRNSSDECATRRPFQCPQCSAWLRLPYAQDVPRGLTPLLLAGLIAYRLGLRDFQLLIASFAGFWVLLVPVGILLGRLLPIRPRRDAPPWGGLGLTGTQGHLPTQEPRATHEGSESEENELHLKHQRR